MIELHDLDGNVITIFVAHIVTIAPAVSGKGTTFLLTLGGLSVREAYADVLYAIRNRKQYDN